MPVNYSNVMTAIAQFLDRMENARGITVDIVDNPGGEFGKIGVVNLNGANLPNPRRQAARQWAASFALDDITFVS